MAAAATVEEDGIVPSPPKDTNDTAQKCSVVVGVRGVRLKHFEQALVKLLPHVEPRYLPLDALSALSPQDRVCSLKKWDDLPVAARVHGNLPGQLPDKQKATRKEGQIRSLLECIFAVLPKDDVEKSGLTIVDFGGGSGHLSIPLALLLPHCRIVCLDLKQKSLDFLHDKAHKCKTEMDMEDPPTAATISTPPQADDSTCNSRWMPTAIPNLFTYSGDIESYTDSFQIGVALHVCGEATDVVLRKCAQNKAHLVVAPCCVGKLNRQKKNPYIYRATAQNTPTVQYPQSQIFRQCLLCSNNNPKDDGNNDSGNNKNGTTLSSSSSSTTTVSKILADYWDAMAKAADYNHELDTRDCRNAARRTAKGLLEMDRQLYLQEAFPYRTVLTRMDPLTASPKNDILVGYYNASGGQDCPLSPILVSPNLQKDQVVTWTKEHLLSPASVDSNEKSANASVRSGNIEETENPNSVDWSWKEEEEIRQQLASHFELTELNSSLGDTPANATAVDVNVVSCTDETDASTGIANERLPSTLIFPKGMGKRKRKLVHYVAENMGLAHWCVGRKYSEKTVAVRKKYIRTS